MKIPKSFNLAGTKWTVQEISNLSACGETHVHEALIKIKANMPKQSKEQTFLHELLHAIYYTRGDLGEHDEKEIDSTAHFLHQYLVQMYGKD